MFLRSDLRMYGIQSQSLSLDWLRIPSLEPSDLITVVGFISRPPNVFGDLESVSSGTLQSWDGVGLSLPGAPSVSQPRVTGKRPRESFGKTPQNTVALNPPNPTSFFIIAVVKHKHHGREPRSRSERQGRALSTAPALPWGHGSGLWHPSAFPKGERAGAGSAPSSPVLPAPAPRGQTRLFVVLCVNTRDQRCS